jgi:hypothetical protein
MNRYIVSVISINSIGEGKVLPGTGQARFKTSYTAVVFKPFKGEVMDGRVTNVNKVSCPGRDNLIPEADDPDGFLRNGRTITSIRLVSCKSLSRFSPHYTPTPPFHDEL